MWQWTRAAALCSVAAMVLTSGVGSLQGAGQTPPGSSPAGPLAYSCGVPATPLEPGAPPQQAIFPSGSSLAEGVTVDAQGNVYGADFLMDVRKFVLTRGRQTN
jgi:hypothetical protein